MKLILILIFTIFALNSYAENFVSISKLGTNQGFQLKTECERVTSEKCFDLGDLPQSVYSVVNVLEDDYKKPLYDVKSNVTPCEGQACYALQVGLCSEGLNAYVSEDLTSVYCTKLLGYEKKEVSSIGLDSSKKAAYDLKIQSDAVKALEESKIQAKLLRMESGKRVIAFINVRNDSKSLTVDQVALLISTYSDIKNALETGSLTTAKALVSLKNPDGVVMTSDDKAAIISEIERLDK